MVRHRVTRDTPKTESVGRGSHNGLPVSRGTEHSIAASHEPRHNVNLRETKHESGGTVLVGSNTNFRLATFSADNPSTSAFNPTYNAA
ncbi:hypothetical protein T265_04259 [Opisthorchis viverrini]|uniref:Uncharacterized protein n=1 Tax=Opisthorchis viverrini TaxID=6198 RepID=A0A075AGU6_OPIVI|nr:hypothetical protein T265_04259 [Opisthorchis viverrini]KER29074.1 hypothetical protein T265_04259 [Opisthorchis viverrini]